MKFGLQIIKIYLKAIELLVRHIIFSVLILLLIIEQQI